MEGGRVARPPLLCPAGSCLGSRNGAPAVLSGHIMRPSRYNERSLPRKASDFTDVSCGADLALAPVGSGLGHVRAAFGQASIPRSES